MQTLFLLKTQSLYLCQCSKVPPVNMTYPVYCLDLVFAKHFNHICLIDMNINFFIYADTFIVLPVSFFFLYLGPHMLLNPSSRKAQVGGGRVNTDAS